VKEHPFFSRVSRTINKSVNTNAAWAKTIELQTGYDVVNDMAAIQCFWTKKKLSPTNISLSFYGTNSDSCETLGILLGDRVAKLQIEHLGRYLFPRGIKHFTALQSLTLTSALMDADSLEWIEKFPALTYLKLARMQFPNDDDDNSLFGNIQDGKFIALVELVLYTSHVTPETGTRVLSTIHDARHPGMQVSHILNNLNRDHLPNLKILRVDTHEMKCSFICRDASQHIDVKGSGAALIKTLDLFELKLCPSTPDEKACEQYLSGWKCELRDTSTRLQFSICQKEDCKMRRYRAASKLDDAAAAAEEEDDTEEEEEETERDAAFLALIEPP
jgi:hypothetical protein